jgi:hypothetical protein
LADAGLRQPDAMRPQANRPGKVLKHQTGPAQTTRTGGRDRSAVFLFLGMLNNLFQK